MELIAFVCVVPLVLFGAGFLACYLLLVRYRFRFERRFDDYEPAHHRGRKEEVWQP